MQSTTSVPNSITRVGERDIFFVKEEHKIEEALQYRPFVCIAVEEHVQMKSIIAVSIGSRGMEPGIEVHLQFPFSTKFIKGYETSYIYPWAIYTFSTHQIQIPVVGKLRKDVYEALMECVKYHLGFSKEMPPYLEERCYPVTYHTGKWDGDRLLLCSTDLSKEEKEDIEPFNAPKVVEAKTPDIVPIESIKPVEIEEETPQQQEIAKIVEEKVIPIPTGLMPAKSDGTPPVTEHENGNKKVGSSTPTLTRKISAMTPSMRKIFEEMSEADKARVLGRVISPSAFAKDHGNAPVFGYRFRNSLEDKYITRENFKAIRTRLFNKPSNVKFLSEIEEVIFSCYMTPQMAGMSIQEYRTRTTFIRKKWGMKDPEDSKLHWRGREELMERALPGCLTKGISKERELKVLDPSTMKSEIVTG